MTVAMAGGASSGGSSCCGAVTERDARTVATLRDTLLPKLISGKLRVKDAERFIGSANAVAANLAHLRRSEPCQLS